MNGAPTTRGSNRAPIPALALAAVLTGAGCRSTDRAPARAQCGPDRSPPSAASPVEEARPERSVWTSIGTSVEGRPLEAASFGEGPATVLMLATIHGDEAAGTPLLRELAERLVLDPEWARGTRVVVVPVANPDGFDAGRRYNARGVDLNRNFPAENRRAGRSHGEGALSEPESRALHELVLSTRPERIVSIHQPVGCIDYDGPAGPLAERMSAASGLPVQRLGARPGSLGSFAGVGLGIPTVTVELPRGPRLDGPRAWELYGPLVRAAVEFRD